jgi:hypothetical protein
LTFFDLSIQSPTLGSWYSGRMRAARLCPAGRKCRSPLAGTHLHIHGHSIAGAVSIVIARVALTVAFRTISSPDIGPETSASVAPQRVCQRWNGAP